MIVRELLPASSSWPFWPHERQGSGCLTDHCAAIRQSLNPKPLYTYVNTNNYTTAITTTTTTTTATTKLLLILIIIVILLL